MRFGSGRGGRRIHRRRIEGGQNRGLGGKNEEIEEKGRVSMKGGDQWKTEKDEETITCIEISVGVYEG